MSGSWRMALPAWTSRRDEWLVHVQSNSAAPRALPKSMPLSCRKTDLSRPARTALFDDLLRAA